MRANVRELEAFHEETVEVGGVLDERDIGPQDADLAGEVLEEDEGFGVSE